MQPLLTIITLTKNSEDYVQNCLNSLNNALLKVDSREVTHLIVDGNSDDQTLEIIKKSNSNSTIFNNPPKGLYNSLNFALTKVTTPYVTYLHSDDELDENYLFYMLKSIKNKKSKTNTVFVGSVEFINSESKSLYVRKPPFYFKSIQKKNNLIFHPNACYPTVLEQEYPYIERKYGRHSDSFHILEIMEFASHARVKKAKYKFRISKNSITYSKGINSKQKTFLSRIYIHFFETNILQRFIMKIYGKSYWS